MLGERYTTTDRGSNLNVLIIHFNESSYCSEMSQRAGVCAAALESINADLKGVTYDSPQAVPIGTVACSIMCLVLAAVIILDSGKLYSDLKMMKSNVRRLMGRPSNKVDPSP